MVIGGFVQRPGGPARALRLWADGRLRVWAKGGSDEQESFTKNGRANIAYMLELSYNKIIKKVLLKRA